MIEEPGSPSMHHYLFESENTQNYQGVFPLDGEYSIPRDIDTSSNLRQAHQKPEELWSRN